MNSKCVDFMDKFENTGVRINDAVGDDTTFVLTRTSESCKSVAAGMNPTDLRRGIQMAVVYVVDGLQKLSMDVTGKDKATTPEYEKEKLQERLAKMSAGVAVIKVGGVSEVEVGEKKDRIVNALNATRAAMAEGIVPGGGAALLWASRSLNTLYDSCANLDLKVGMEIVERACRAPATQIAKNAGHEGVAVVGNLLENDSPELGFNAQTGEYVNLVDTGIIDPTQIVRMALMDASSVASLIMTADHPEEPGAAGGIGEMM